MDYLVSYNNNMQYKKSNQAGQALVEYLLLISFSVILIVGFKSFLSNMGGFINNYLGSYTRCLLEYGELPSLGIDNSDLNLHKEEGKDCNSSYTAFTLASGRQPISNQENKSYNNNNPNKNSNENSNGRNRKNSSANNAISDNNALSSNNKSNLNRNAQGVMDGAASSASDVKTIEEGSEEGARLSRFSVGNQNNGNRSSNRYKVISGKLNEELQKKIPIASKKVKETRIIAKVDEENAPGPRKSNYKQPPAKQKGYLEDKEEEFGMGSFVKWLIIIGILIVLFILIGGQILNYSNSDSN